MIRCYLPFRSMMVRRDGIVLACCYNKIPMGNLNTQTIEEIWHGDNYKRLRESILDDSCDFGCLESCPHTLDLQ
jgi:MoaA/NifB/PqqE/SkfB family radical SAM enzyme